MLEKKARNFQAPRQQQNTANIQVLSTDHPILLLNPGRAACKVCIFCQETVVCWRWKSSWEEFSIWTTKISNRLMSEEKVSVPTCLSAEILPRLPNVEMQHQSLEVLSIRRYKPKDSSTWTAFHVFWCLKWLLQSCTTPGLGKYSAASSKLPFLHPHLLPSKPHVVQEGSEMLQNTVRQNFTLTSSSEVHKFLTLWEKSTPNLTFFVVLRHT